jgi:hypothetical protein
MPLKPTYAYYPSLQDMVGGEEGEASTRPPGHGVVGHHQHRALMIGQGGPVLLSGGQPWIRYITDSSRRSDVGGEGPEHDSAGALASVCDLTANPKMANSLWKLRKFAASRFQRMTLMSIPLVEVDNIHG